jgi:cytochrome c
VKDDNRLGPSLYGVVGRKAGSLASYHGYSPSLQGADIMWTPDMLDKWITDPNAVASGNNMAPPFPGVADPAERKQIIAYLKSDTNEKQGQAAPQKPAPTATP